MPILTFEDALKEIGKYAYQLGWGGSNLTLFFDREIYRLVMLHEKSGIVIDQSYQIIDLNLGPQFVYESAIEILDIKACAFITKH